jgi:hypothetical protein
MEPGAYRYGFPNPFIHFGLTPSRDDKERADLCDQPVLYFYALTK